MSHTTTSNPHRLTRVDQPPAAPIVPTVVAVAADRPRLPAPACIAHSSPDASTRCRPPCSTASSPAPGSAPHSGRCSATAASASAGSRQPPSGSAPGSPSAPTLVSYRTDITSLAVMGAVSGLAVGIAQGATLGSASACSAGARPTPRCSPSAGPSPPPAASTSASSGSVFGAYGCFTLAFLQSTFIGAFVPGQGGDVMMSSLARSSFAAAARSSPSGSCCCSPPAPSAAQPSPCSPRASAPDPAPNRAASPSGSTTSPRPAARSPSSPTASTSTTPPSQRRVTAGLERIAAIDGVIAVVDPWSTGSDALRASDGRAALAVVTVTGGLDEEAEVELAHEITDVARDLDAPEVLVGGNVLVGEQFGTASENDLLRGEAIALPIAFVAMIFLLGGLRAAGMPFLVALAGVVTSLAVLVAATVLGDVSIFSINVVNMLGIGLGIDYGLLMVNRFREERGHGRELHDAVVQTVATAGTTVVFSALTVAVAMCGLFVFGVPILSSFGIAGLGVVLLCMAAAVTLLPGDPRRRRRQDPADSSRRRRRGPLLPAHPVGAGPRRRRRRRRRGRARPARRAVPRCPLRDRRRPHPAPVIRGPRRRPHPRRPVPGTRHRPRHRDRRHRRRQRRVRRTGSSSSPPRPASSAPRSGPTRHEASPSSTSRPPAPHRVREASALVAQLRSTQPTFDTEVGGIAAELIDIKARLSERLPLAALMVVAATLVLLFLMTGSIIVPIKAVIMNILSLGASFGALVWIFQDGHLAGVLGFDSVGALDLWMPVLILIFAFGLSMDYEVFLLSRIKEVHDETGDSDLAVAVGLQRSGRIITSAAFLIVIVFAGFAAGEVLAIKQLGVGLAIAVLVDATIVRTLLVPATMKLLGERNWWAPAPLRRFHQRYGLHEAPAPTTPRTRESAIDLGQTTADTDPEVQRQPVGAGSGTMLR